MQVKWIKLNLAITHELFQDWSLKLPAHMKHLHTRLAKISLFVFSHLSEQKFFCRPGSFEVSSQEILDQSEMLLTSFLQALEKMNTLSLRITD